MLALAVKVPDASLFIVCGEGGVTPRKHRALGRLRNASAKFVLLVALRDTYQVYP